MHYARSFRIWYIVNQIHLSQTANLGKGEDETSYSSFEGHNGCCSSRSKSPISVSRDLSDKLLEAVESQDGLQSNDLKERIAAIVTLLSADD